MVLDQGQFDLVYNRRFVADPLDPLLRAHELTSSRASSASTRAFRIDDDLRVLFRWDGDVCLMVALSNHDEVH